MKPKYTEEQELEMTTLYEAAETEAERSDVVDELADKYLKNRRMIVAKLSKMDIYISKPRTSKVTGKTPETKRHMVGRLETKLGYPPGDFDGLDKAPKIVLQKLLEEHHAKNTV